MQPPSPLTSLDTAAAEIEAYVGEAGWDQRPTLFALVRTAELVRDDPDLAARLGLDESVDAPGSQDLTPVEQEELPEGDLDEVLAQVGWPDAVAGCAICHEVVILPPDAADSVADDAVAAAGHPDRREARLVVAVLRDGSSASVLRLRRLAENEQDELLSGPELAPNLVAALLDTLRDDETE